MHEPGTRRILPGKGVSAKTQHTPTLGGIWWLQVQHYGIADCHCGCQYNHDVLSEENIMQTEQKLRRLVDGKLARHIAVRVEAVAAQTAQTWIAQVRAARLWSVEKTEYVESIDYKMLDDTSAVVRSTYHKASEIETGRPPRDLKRMLDTSLKVRRSKTGRRYLYIPFIHSVESLPANVLTAAMSLSPSRIKRGLDQRITGTGAWDTKTRAPLMVDQRRYAWGGRLGGDFGDKHKGMYRFESQARGKVRGSTYLTFRTMAEGQRGWVVPAQPGLYIAKAVIEQMHAAVRTG